MEDFRLIVIALWAIWTSRNKFIHEGDIKTVQLGLLLGLKDVEIEGDYRTVIQKLQDERKDRSDIEVLIKDTKQLCSRFEVCSFRFIPRDSNKVAHFVAKVGLKKRESTYLLNTVVTEAAELVLEDRRWTKSMRR
ncbi:hypothetical protein J1N35_030431 [Gossypium stocksii]|uniref:RNase H type-1 domain-containing protein n=1 Tax=Gossypium stocksii TaxID=47602 RepID=A0A9D3V0Y5_9ROSI|nr:hypothetical protein J1N35_030431 [Gossypium stocksii]